MRNYKAFTILTVVIVCLVAGGARAGLMGNCCRDIKSIQSVESTVGEHEYWVGSEKHTCQVKDYQYWVTEWTPKQCPMPEKIGICYHCSPPHQYRYKECTGYQDYCIRRIHLSCGLGQIAHDGTRDWCCQTRIFKYHHTSDMNTHPSHY
jgi:hypothetical protein